MMELTMTGLGRTFRVAIATGTVASVTSTLALGLLARSEGKGALQPVNAISHWLNGKKAGSFTHMRVCKQSMKRGDTGDAATLPLLGQSRTPQNAAAVRMRAVPMRRRAKSPERLSPVTR